MSSKNSGKTPSPQKPSGRPSRDEIVALALGCMCENAEKLARQVRQNGGTGGYICLNRRGSEKS